MSEEDRLEKTAKRASLDLKECEQRYLSLFNQARDGIVLIDTTSGCIVDCNPEYEKLTGRKPDSWRSSQRDWRETKTEVSR